MVVATSGDVECLFSESTAEFSVLLWYRGHVNSLDSVVISFDSIGVVDGELGVIWSLDWIVLATHSQ
jgi:hypothetical protein